MATVKSEFTLKTLAEMLDVGFRGDPDQLIDGIGTLASATATQLSIYHNPRYHQALRSTAAGAVILSSQHVGDCATNMLVTEAPYPCFARATQLFSQRRHFEAGIHPSAVVDAKAMVGQGVCIGPFAVVSAGARIGDGSYIGARCFIGPDTSVGEGSWLYPGVSLYSATRLGRNQIIHSGVVIGSDGFGFAHDGHEHVKIEQLGGVVTGDNVEIGANTTIDRGALDDTVIGHGVKIDNQVQIAHNVVIGDNSVICGCSAIAGSAKIGADCIIAGAAGVINHVTIADGVTVTAMTLVNQDIRKAGVYSSGTGMSETALWKRNVVRFRELDTMARRIRVLESDRDE